MCVCIVYCLQSAHICGSGDLLRVRPLALTSTIFVPNTPCRRGKNKNVKNSDTIFIQRQQIVLHVW